MGIEHIGLYSLTGKHLRYAVNPLRLWDSILSGMILLNLFKISGM